LTILHQTHMDNVHNHLEILLNMYLHYFHH
jgi:hypothetical protein